MGYVGNVQQKGTGLVLGLEFTVFSNLCWNFDRIAIGSRLKPEPRTYIYIYYIYIYIYIFFVFLFGVGGTAGGPIYIYIYICIYTWAGVI